MKRLQIQHHRLRGGSTSHFTNAAILILAAAVFHKQGYTGVSEIRMHTASGTARKKFCARAFRHNRCSAGQSSTVTVRLAGQIIVSYLHLRIAPWLRRVITVCWRWFPLC
ncbi:MAG: divalent metal cation transporter [Saprospiraceae bacterium]